MSILIRNMEMPKNCGECPFATPTRDGLMCDAVSFLAKCLTHPVSRMSCCPLIELPPHGRLIDADALIEAVPPTNVDIFENCRRCELLDQEQVIDLINDAPTIIESEGEDGAV